MLKMRGRMAKAALTLTPQQAAGMSIDVEIAQKLAATLSTYHDLKLQRDLLDEAMKTESKKIQAEMDLLGVEKIEIEGTPCTIVGGYTRTLDKIKFVELGGSLKTLENATVSKPRKKYLRIGKAGEEE